MDSPGPVAAHRWSRAKVIVLLVAATLVSAALADVLFVLRPVAAEKFWIGGLHFGTASLRDEATFKLRNYPTRGAAVALVSHIRNRVRAGDFRSAARATETLGILAGRSWKSTEPGQWPDVLEQIDLWAERHLGEKR